MSEQQIATPEAQPGDAAVIPAVAEQVSEVPEQKAEKPEVSDEAKKLQAMQRRIDRLTRDKYEMKAQLETRQPPKVETPPEQTRPLTQEEFDKAVERRAAEKAQLDAVKARADAIAEAGEKAFKDFGEKVRTVFQELPLFDRNGHQTPVMEAIADCDKPEAVLHYLGSNPDEAAEIAELTPARQARRIALIEQSLNAKPETTKTKSEVPKPLRAEKPAAAKGAPDPSDTAAWIRYENARALGRS